MGTIIQVVEWHTIVCYRLTPMGENQLARLRSKNTNGKYSGAIRDILNKRTVIDEYYERIN